MGEGVTSKEWLCVSTDDIEVVGLDVLGDLLLEGVSGEVFVDEDCGGLTGDLDVVLSLCSLARMERHKTHTYVTRYGTLEHIYTLITH